MGLRIVLRVMCLAALLVSINGAAGVDLNNPTALAFDHSGNLFVADHSPETILKFTPDGTRSVFVTGVRLSEGNGLVLCSHPQAELKDRSSPPSDVRRDCHDMNTAIQM